jgi:inner membrane protein
MSKLSSKVAFVAALALAMSVMLFCIHHLVEERSERRTSAIRDVAESSAGAQTLFGPILVLPASPAAGDAKAGNEQPARSRTMLFPAKLVVASDADTVARHRGIYQVPSYRSHHQLVASFELPTYSKGTLAPPPSTVEFMIAVSDLRGLHNSPFIEIGELHVPLEPRKVDGVAVLAASLSTDQWSAGVAREMKLELDIEGTNSIDYRVIGRDVHVGLKSNWATPSFYGQSLPTQRNVTSNGFSANWDSNQFTAPLPSIGDHIAESFVSVGPPQFAVNFLEPVDVYHQVDRATKYGALFVGLTFCALAAYEVNRRKAISLIQYALVGKAVTLFYLLLLSLAEHVPFLMAYAVAAAACTGLTGYYLRHVLGGRMQGVGFGALLVSYLCCCGSRSSRCWWGRWCCSCCSLRPCT